MEVEEAVAAAIQAGFENLEFVWRWARKTVELRLQEGSGNSSRLDSRLGGLPALPKSLSWPRWHSCPLAFIGQVSLENQPGSIVEAGFPEQGLLLFFSYVDWLNTTLPVPWGAEQKDMGSSVVLHVPANPEFSIISDWPQDLPQNVRFKECLLMARETITLPAWDSIIAEPLNLDTPEKRITYGRITEVLEGGEPSGIWPNRCLLGGHPDQLQHDMLAECAVVREGLSLYDEATFEEPRWSELKERGREWRLIMQVPSVEPLGMIWGDMGCLYYCIREADLLDCRFDRSWMVLHST